MPWYLNEKRVIYGFGIVAAAAWVYCLVIAPLLSDASWKDVAYQKALDMGVGYTLSLIHISEPTRRPG